MPEKEEKIRGRARGSKRQRTRGQLIDAAAAVVGEKGFDRASLEEIARAAGMTRGAFYNNFADKEELFMAVAETLWEPIAPPLREGASLREQMSILGKTVAAAAGTRRAAAVGALSFQVYALTSEELRKRLVKANRDVYKWAEEQLLKYVDAEDLPMPPGEFVRALHALTEGLLALKFLTPELISDQIIIAAFEAMAGSGPIPEIAGNNVTEIDNPY